MKRSFDLRLALLWAALALFAVWIAASGHAFGAASRYVRDASYVLGIGVSIAAVVVRRTPPTEHEIRRLEFLARRR